MKVKPHIEKSSFGIWYCRFGKALYTAHSFDAICRKSRWLWWHQPRLDLETCKPMKHFK